MDSIKGLKVIPNYQQFMRPFLEIAQEANSNEIKLRNVINRLTSKFALTEYEKAETLPNGKQNILDNRVGWARTYLIRRVHLIFNERGINALQDTDGVIKPLKMQIILPPDETLLAAYKKTNDALAQNTQGNPTFLKLDINSSLNPIYRE